MWWDFILSSIPGVMQVLNIVIQWIMTANPLMVALVGAIVAFVGKRIAEGVGIALILYAIFKIAMALISHSPII